MSLEDVINETVEARVREAYAAGRKAAFAEAIEECQMYEEEMTGLNRDIDKVVQAAYGMLAALRISARISARITQRAK
jgi:flagellar biosynthesis/type III secretory pathway protein FliH